MEESFNWPKTVQEAVDQLKVIFPDALKEEIKNIAYEDGLYIYHHGIGTGIRNTFGLWAGNWDLIVSAGRHPDEPIHEAADGASHNILVALWKDLNGWSL